MGHGTRYFSSPRGQWLAAKVVKVSGQRFQIDLKDGDWFTAADVPVRFKRPRLDLQTPSVPPSHATHAILSIFDIFEGGRVCNLLRQFSDAKTVFQGLL